MRLSLILVHSLLSLTALSSPLTVSNSSLTGTNSTLSNSTSSSSTISSTSSSSSSSSHSSSSSSSSSSLSSSTSSSITTSSISSNISTSSTSSITSSPSKNATALVAGVATNVTSSIPASISANTTSSASLNVTATSSGINSTSITSSPTSSALNSTTAFFSNSTTPSATLAPSRNSSSTTSSSTSSTSSAAPKNGPVSSTILIIAADAATAKIASMGLNGYGIPFQTSIGGALPTLNTTAGGNFGGFVVVSGGSLTDGQFQLLYDYQVQYGVRMVQYDVWPDTTYGVEGLGGCCDSGVEQLISFTSTTGFTQSGIRTGATMSTQNLYHYPAKIVSTSGVTTTQIASFAAAAGYAKSVAGVINVFTTGRQQMVFFISFGTDWSPTSAWLQHAWITWVTRGLYAGYRRVNLNTQIDDMFLSTYIYTDADDGTYRVTPTDMTNVAAWVTTLNAKLNTGSKYYPEIGHNGDGNIATAQGKSGGEKKCAPGGIYYDGPASTPLEFQKPLGSGTSVWPTTPTSYVWTTTCTNLDPLKVWFSTAANRDKFMHITHTFTHLELDNATYSDALKEIQFNQAWLSQTGIANGKFTANGLIPPAITGLHNGDVIRAWSDAGLTNCVGDNTRPVLRNQQNDMWPLITTMASNGFDGFQVNPRWATRIYYNCDSTDCTAQEWADTSAGTGVWDDLIALDKADGSRQLLGLYHDPYMFHQANLRNTGTTAITINGVKSKISIFQAWVETVTQEFVRLVNWPIITLKHADMSAAFAARMARDQCNYNIAWTSTSKKITGLTVTAGNGNTCSEPIPVTVPGKVTNTQGFTTEQVGNDPLTIWVTLSGSPVTFTLSSAVAW